MLDFLRRKVKSPYMQAILLIIILVFVFWGTNIDKGGRQTVVATVNGESIPYEDFDRAYNNAIDSLSNRFGGTLPKDLIDREQIKIQVINQLIRELLIQQSAREMGLLASKDEIKKSILENEIFQVDGQFDQERYGQILTGSRLTADDYEAGIAFGLLADKVTKYLGRFARVSPGEEKEHFTYDYQESKLLYVTFNASDFKEKVEFIDDDLNSFFTEKQDDYRTPPLIKIKYLSFISEDNSDLLVSEQDTERYYRNHLEKYSRHEERQARHILIKISDSDEDEQIKTKQEQAEKILEMAMQGKDFGELAKEYSEDGSASAGGDLGFFSRGRMVKPFENAVFSLQEGELSKVVSTEFGFHIIKLEKIRPASVTPIEKVRDEINSIIMQDKSGALVFQMANTAYENIILSGSLAKYSETGEAVIRETDLFSKKSPPEGITRDPSFLEAAFNLKKGELSSLIEIRGGYAIIFVEDIKGSEIPSLEEVKEDVKTDFVAARAKNLAKKTAESLLEKIKSGEDFDVLAKKLGVTVKESDFVSRTKNNSKELPYSVTEKGFGLSSQKPYPDNIESTGATFYVFRLKEKKMPEKGQFEGKQEELRKQMLQKKNINLLIAWAEYLKSSADISINPDFI
ncbi:MAG: SurA N-terminal domain-containing protein [Thermodesulfobacteriota bacterium]|nr:SurA N-terminal domain-containing protein [Thermodesulfobacteriota bacterium]